MENNLPNFLCVGAQKSATTSLSESLKNHPDIFVHEKKELHFFDDENYMGDINKYKEYFMDSLNFKIRTDFTPEYLYYKEIPQRIFEKLGNDVKILIIIRNPIQRALSHYRMTRYRGLENLNFEEAFYSEKERIKTSHFHKLHYSYFDRGIYMPQINRYLKLFKKVKIIKFEDLINDTESTLKDLFNYLDITNFNVELPKENVAKVVRFKIIEKFMIKIGRHLKKLNILKSAVFFKKIRQKLRVLNTIKKKSKIKLDDAFYDVLYNYYLDDIQKLEKKFKIDLSEWKEYHNSYK